MQEARKLFIFIKSYMPLLALALLFLVASGLLETLLIMLLSPILKAMAPGGLEAASGDRFQFLTRWLGLGGDDTLLRISIFLILFSLLKGLFLYCAEYSMSFVGQRVVAGLRHRLFDTVLDQSMAFFSRNPTGKLMARIITDTERLQETVSKTLTDFMRQVVLFIAFMGVVFYADWKLALFSTAVAPLVMFITANLGKRMRKVSLRSQENLSEISHALQETISGQRIVKAFCMEQYERGRFRRLVDYLVGTNLKQARIGALSSPLMEFIGYAAFAPFLLYANYQINQGFSFDSFMVFLAALFRLYEPVRKLSRMHLYFQQASASAERVFEILETPVEVKDSPGAVALPPFSKSIRFEHIDFRYRETDQRVLRDINLEIPKNEIVALVGPSGAGKTSLINLIPRFYDVEGGQVSIDGIDISKATLASLRAQIAVVTQETFLFNDSIRKNIAYGREDHSLDEVVEAAKSAFIHDFVESLPDRYETVIGERGQRLSGGQKQRLAIARAVIKRAPILILDEATSALDSESERLVQRALNNLMQHCTTLVIAHRLSTVRLANRIVVMQDGRIVEEGNHESLMESSGIYRRLYELQFTDPLGV